MTALLSSWVDSANGSAFPIQNLPYGVFLTPSSGEAHCCTRIGTYILDLYLLSQMPRLFPAELRALVGDSLEAPSWNTFMSKGKAVWSALRQHLIYLLSETTPTLRDDAEARAQLFLLISPPSATTQGPDGSHHEHPRMVLPATIGDYTDFYSSKEHATNLGKMFRPDQAPLLPNWLWLPVAYHGRASSIVVSGTDVHRPHGQTRPDPDAPPVVGPSRRVDMEVEVAAWIGTPNAHGEPIPEADALDHVFGLSVFNDWSARDIQPWEYVPLGPFLAKNFASTIAPWIVSLLALEPFFTQAPEQAPEPLPYLVRSQPDRAAVDLELTADFTLATGESMRVTTTNYRSMYWTLSQQIAHHTINGCNLRPGDLLASGTISGATKDSWGSLIEITNRGQEPIEFPNGKKRTFVEDGDTIAISAECNKKGVGYRIGFGSATATVRSFHKKE